MSDKMTRFTRGVDFYALSVSDLADARDAYHVHLANLDNVVGTALGRYLIRRSDPDFTDPDAAGKRVGAKAATTWSSSPRTLANSGITRWSWPCVLVFVREWMTEQPAPDRADQVIPRRLYLPDGRQVPTCVVHTPLARDADRQSRTRFGSITPGPGQPLFTDQQGRQRMGTIGALVTDGARVFGLTSRHVLGPAGTAVTIADRGEMKPVGRVADAAIRRPLQSLYPGMAATRAELSIDAGLFALDNIDGWTTQLYGLGTVGDLIDINIDTVALSLIGCPVKAYGAATGNMRGAVLGLFHRWRSIGGVDQIAELLIGPPPPEIRTETTAIQSRPGDSGAVWVWDEDAEPTAEGGEKMRGLDGDATVPVVAPLAMQWGGGVTLGAAGEHPTDYVLASTLASIAQTLGVSLLQDDSLEDHSLYWGKVGHYKVAGSACTLGPAGTKFAALLEANADRIAVSDDKIAGGQMPSANHGGAFVALADVPDLVWRDTRKKDAPSHFADMDEPGGQAVDGKNLMQLWRGRDPKYRTPQGWTEFYDSLPQPPSDDHRGALPFRVAQLYDIMVASAKARDVTTYIAAAGVLAHYVGDACQPLHVSRLHHGLPDDPSDDDVHSVYETKMLDRHAAEIVSGVNSALDGYHAGDSQGPPLVTGSAEAADAVVTLMARTVAAIPPMDIVEVFTANPGAQRDPALWNAFGRKTINRLADGARTLAVLWRSAWDEGGGERIGASRITAQSEQALQALYEDKTFAPNVWLREM